jgi:DNA-directed RNA polymerase subunit K/omega
MDTSDDVLESVPEQPEAPPAPREKAPQIENRFLFVDIAAMRAKQLRRGATPRLEYDQVETPRVAPHKAERVAMEEVRRCLVLYEVPPPPGPPAR